MLSLAVQELLGTGSDPGWIWRDGTGRDCACAGWAAFHRGLIFFAKGNAKGEAAQADEAWALTTENIFILVNYSSASWPSIEKWQDVS